MKKILLAIGLLLSSALSAQAADVQYLLQQPTDTNATGLWINKKPTPGVDCPMGSRVCLWVVQNDDVYIGNYAIDDQGKQVYTKVAPPPAVQVKPALPLAFKKALNEDPNIPDSVKVSLFPYIGLIDNYQNDPAGTIDAWVRTKTTLNIPAQVAAIIEAYAAQFNMPLTPN